MKIHLIDDEIYLYLFLQISIQQLSKPSNCCLIGNKEIKNNLYNIPVNLQNNK